MAYRIDMNLVVRCNYGDDSIALIEYLRENRSAFDYHTFYVVYIDTGWAASSWPARVAAGVKFVKTCGFTAIQLSSRVSFSALVQERKDYPSRKFQWCAGFLKGLPLLEWLDKHDPGCEWTIAIPKRQSQFRKRIPARIEECEYHGERSVIHPILKANDQDCQQWLQQAGFEPLRHRSLECEPCVNSTPAEFAKMSDVDLQKMKQLEIQLQKKWQGAWQHPSEQLKAGDQFSMGCGDPFGCGL